MSTKKELKKEYKQMKPRIGVFRITNNSSGKIFIGSSLNLKASLNSQKVQLETGTHPNSELQHDWFQYGASEFTFDVVQELKQSDNENADPGRDVKQLEELVKEELQPYGDKGYNKKKINK